MTDTDAIRNQIIAGVRRLHYYGDPPDVRLADDVTGDVADIMDLVDRYAARRRTHAEQRAWSERR